MSSLPPPATPVSSRKTSPIVWVVAVIAVLGAYAIYHSNSGNKTAEPPAAGHATPAAPATGSSNAGLKVPEWVPIYPGTTPSDIQSHSTPSELYTTFKLR